MTPMGYEFEFSRRPQHDGTLSCILCFESSIDTEYEWCEAAQCLVCRDCCEALISGNPLRLMTITTRAGRMICPEALMQACSECDRGNRMFEQRVLDEAAEQGGRC